MADVLFHLNEFFAADVGRSPTFPPCFLSCEWKILDGALELVIQIPKR